MGNDIYGRLQRLLSLHQSHPGGLRHINMMSFYLGKEGHKKAKNLDTKVIITLYFLLYSGIAVHTWLCVSVLMHVVHNVPTKRWVQFNEPKILKYSVIRIMIKKIVTIVDVSYVRWLFLTFSWYKIILKVKSIGSLNWA